MPGNKIQDLKDEGNALSTLAKINLPHSHDVNMDMKGKLGYVALNLGLDGYFFRIAKSARVGLFADIRLANSKHYLNGVEKLADTAAANARAASEQSIQAALHNIAQGLNEGLQSLGASLKERDDAMQKTLDAILCATQKGTDAVEALDDKVEDVQEAVEFVDDKVEAVQEAVEFVGDKVEAVGDAVAALQQGQAVDVHVHPLVVNPTTASSVSDNQVGDVHPVIEDGDQKKCGCDTGNGEVDTGKPTASPVVLTDSSCPVAAPVTVTSSLLERKHMFSFLVGPSARICTSPNMFFTVGVGLYGQESKYHLKATLVSADVSANSKRLWQIGGGAKLGAFYRMSQGLFFGAEASGHMVAGKSVTVEDSTNNVKLTFKSKASFGGVLSLIAGYDFIG